MRDKFIISGMTCTACAAAVERKTESLDGVKSAVVNFATEKLNVDYDPNLISPKNIEQAIDSIGYGATLENAVQESMEERSEDQEKLMRDRMIYSLIFTIPLFYLSMGPMVGLPIPSFLAGEMNIGINALTQLLLCLPVLYIGAHFYKDGFKALFYRVPNMDSLVAVGTSAAFFYSIYVFYMILIAFSKGDLNMLHHYAHDLYFESTVVILTLISVGKYLEARAKGKTSQAIEKLVALAPDEARVERNNEYITIPVSDVVIGDIITIRPGERIPVDGIVESGNTSIDESVLTGESIPVEKQIGDNVAAGTINKSGFITFKATRVGSDTTLSRIIELVEEAQSTKAPIAKLADKISRYFVPAVMTIALLAFILWFSLGYGFSFSLSIAIAILVISCPCALGLATPTAIMVATGVGAGRGILFRNGEALETLGKTDVIVFDKTGTLTKGKPEVTDIIPIDNFDSNLLLQLSASLEDKSEHPLSEAIVIEAENKELEFFEVTSFNALSGRGITGEIDNKKIVIGNSALMQENHISTEKYTKKIEELSDQGKTPLFIAQDHKLIGIIAVADVIREDAPQMIEQLRALGKTCYMLTGDNSRTARAIAEQIGISHVIAEVLPDQKAAVIEKLQSDKKVTMVGDGINDAPALATADNGIAIGTGTDVAIESADIILMRDDLMQIPTAIELSLDTLKNIRQNLFWAFIYNVICIPVAAGILYIPFGIRLNAMFAAAAMSMSSVSVVLNALSLKTFKEKIYPVKKEKINTEVLSFNDFLNSHQTSDNPINMEENMQINFKVNDMSCEHCQNRVKNLLEDQPGVLSASVNLNDGTATIECEPGTNVERIAEVITDNGYPTTALDKVAWE